MDLLKILVFEAVLENNIEMIHQLLKGLNITLKDLSDEKRVDVMVYLAVKNNFQGLVKVLVNYGANVNGAKTIHVCPLLLAIRLGNVKMTELLIDLGASIDEGWMKPYKVMNPLHCAIRLWNLEIVQLLLGRGANVNERDVKRDDTALHILSTRDYTYNSEEENKIKQINQVKIAKALLEKGADINARNHYDFTPLDCALQTGKTLLCKLFFQEGAPVKKTLANGIHFEYLKVVLCTQPCPQLIRHCLEHGCDFGLINKVHRFKTPYHFALASSQPDIIKVFLEFGCPFDLPMSDKRKANTSKSHEPKVVFKASHENVKLLAVQKYFIEGIKMNNLKSVKAALILGAEPKGCSMEVPSTLHYIAAKGNHEMAKLLLMKGVPVNHINAKGETPLFIAVKNKNVEAAKTFLKFGASIDFGNSHRYSSKTLFENCDELKQLFELINKCFELVNHGNKSVFTLIKSYLSDDNSMLSVLMNCVNRQGISLMGTALQKGHIKIAEDLMKLRVYKL